MRYTKRIIIFIFAVFLLVGMAAATASAQTRKHRVVRYYYVQPDPFWPWNRYGNDPYYYDPYLRAQRTRYYKERDVRDKRKDLAEDREEYNADGYLTPKEQKKLAKAERKYQEAVADLRDYDSDY
jgi:hypothetical protein